MFLTLYYMYATFLQWWKISTMRSKISKAMNNQSALVVYQKEKKSLEKHQANIKDLLFFTDTRIGCTMIPKRKIFLNGWMPFSSSTLFPDLSNSLKLTSPSFPVLVQADLKNFNTNNDLNNIQIADLGIPVAWTAEEEFSIILKTDLDNFAKLISCFLDNSMVINDGMEVMQIETIELIGEPKIVENESVFKKIKWPFPVTSFKQWNKFVADLKHICNKTSSSAKNGSICGIEDPSDSRSTIPIIISEVKSIPNTNNLSLATKEENHYEPSKHRSKTAELKPEKRHKRHDKSNCSIEKAKEKDKRSSNKEKDKLKHSTSSDKLKQKEYKPRESAHKNKRDKFVKKHSREDILDDKHSEEKEHRDEEIGERDHRERRFRERELEEDKIRRDKFVKKLSREDILDDKHSEEKEYRDEEIEERQRERDHRERRSRERELEEDKTRRDKFVKKLSREDILDDKHSQEKEHRDEEIGERDHRERRYRERDLEEDKIRRDKFVKKLSREDILDDKHSEEKEYRDEEIEERQRERDHRERRSRERELEEDKSPREKFVKKHSREDILGDKTEEREHRDKRSRDKDEAELKDFEIKESEVKDAPREESKEGELDEREHRGKSRREKEEERESRREKRKEKDFKGKETKELTDEELEERKPGRERRKDLKGREITESDLKDKEPKAKEVKPEMADKVAPKKNLIKTKPPNVLVYADSLETRENVKTVLNEVLNINRYTIYELSASSAPHFTDNSTLAVVCGNVNPNLTAHLLHYLLTGGNLLCLCSDFLNSVLHTFTTAEVREHELVRFSYGEWKRVRMMHHIFCYQASPAKKHFSQDSDQNSSNHSSSGNSPVAPRTPSAVELHHRNKVYTVQVRVLGQEETWQTPSILLATVKGAQGKAVFSQVHLEIDPTQYQSDENKYIALKESNSARLEILKDILSSHLEMDCTSVPKSSEEYTPAFFLGKHDSKLKLLSEIPGIVDNKLKLTKLTLNFCGKDVSPPPASASLMPVLVHLCPENFSTVEYFENLKTKQVGRLVIYSDVMTSSMDVLDKLKFEHGLAVLPARQTAGAGRGGNAWLSPIGCAMFSLQLHIPMESVLAKALPLVQHLVAIAIVSGIRSQPGYENVELGLKWPNDIYADASVKIGGLIITSSVESSVAVCNAGSGTNLSNMLPTTCINQVITQYNEANGTDLKTLSYEKYLAIVFTELERIYDIVQGGNMEYLYELYYKYWLHSGAEITVQTSDGISREVTVTGIDQFGFLTVKSKDGVCSSVEPDGNSFDMMQGLIAPKIR